MANTYTWTVTAMDCYPQEDGNTDVVAICNTVWTEAVIATYQAAQESTTP